MPKKIVGIIALVLSTCSISVAQTPSSPPELQATIAALDARLFDAYNNCDLKSFEKLFVPNVEFYHDTGGVTWTRKAVIDNTRKYICGKVRRKLVAGSLAVYPIKDFGAIEAGEHRFCEIQSNSCEGIAKFLMVWRLKNGQWQVTRVLSFGHRAATAAEAAMP